MDEQRIDEQGGQADGPPQEEQRSLVTGLLSDLNQVGTNLVSAGAGYGIARVVDKIRKPPEGPGPTASEGVGKDPNPPKADPPAE